MTGNLLPGVDRAQIVKAAAVLMAIIGVLSLCGGVLLFTGGALGGLGIGLGSAVVQQSGQADAEFQQAVAVGAAASGFALVLGVGTIILAPIMLVAAYGLWQRKSWARMLTVAAAGISAVISLLTILIGGGFFNNLVPLLIDGFVAYFFYTDPEIQQILSN